MKRIEIPDGQYSKFFKSKHAKVWKVALNLDGKEMEFHNEEIYKYHGSQFFLNKIVNLPSERVFMIGGSDDLSSKKTYNTLFEFIFNKTTGVYDMVQKANMLIARSAFGCIVYPNNTQIFVCGGSVNEQEATKQCERYIIDQNAWKRLPDLNEPKFSMGLCFFNNGSTLYSFGGLLKNGNSFTPTSVIESLSKGQNNWKVLNVKLPQPIFDIGSFEINNSEIVLYGGFNDGALDKVHFFKIQQTSAEGEIVTSQTSKLADKDFFVSHGMMIKFQGEQNQFKKEFIVTGHNHVHAFDGDARTWRVLPIL